MEKSIFLELSLPNRDDQEDSADINVISENFRIIDSFAKGIKNGNVSNQQVSNALKGEKNDTKIYVSNDSQSKVEPDYSKMLDNSEDYVGYEATHGFHTVLSFDKIAGEHQTVRFTDGGYWETYMLDDAEIAVGEVLYIGSDEVGRTCLFRTKLLSSDGFEAMLTIDDVSPLEHTFGLKICGMTRKSENLIDSSMLSASSNVTILNGIITQIAADSSEGWIKCISTNNGTYISVLGTGTKANGVQSITFTKDDTFNQVNFGIGGTQRDTMVRADVSHLPNGTYTIQANFTNITQGSISWKDMMINEGETALPYEPFFEGLRSAKVTEVESVGANLFKSIKPYSNTTVENGVVNQITADSRTATTFKVIGYNGDTLIGKIASDLTVTNIGIVSLQIQKTHNLTKIRFGVDGSQRDTLVEADVTHLIDGKSYTISFNLTNRTQGSISWCDMMLNEGTTALPYSPYVKNTFPIPQAVQALNGYGDGLNADCYNYIDLEKKQFVQRVGKVDMGTLVWSYQSNYWATSDLRNRVLINYNNPPLLAENYETHGWTGRAEGHITMNADGYIVVPSNDSTIKPTGMLVYELAEPIITDISNMLSGAGNLTSIYPVTNLICDAGANMEVKYNRDINKAFADLESRIAAILG